MCCDWSFHVRSTSLQFGFLSSLFFWVNQVNTLDYLEPISAGRKIQYILAALEEVEQFHQVSGPFQTPKYNCFSRTRGRKHFLSLRDQWQIRKKMVLNEWFLCSWVLITAWDRKYTEGLCANNVVPQLNIWRFYIWYLSYWWFLFHLWEVHSTSSLLHTLHQHQRSDLTPPQKNKTMKKAQQINWWILK